MDKWLYIGTVTIYDSEIDHKIVQRIFGFYSSWNDFIEDLLASYDDSEIIGVQVNVKDFEAFNNLVVIENDEVALCDIWEAMDKLDNT